MTTARTCALAAGFFQDKLQTSDDISDQPYESSQMTFFIANATGIFLVDTYREITEIDRFWAIGSGRAFALGAMDAVFDDPEGDAESIARLGVSAGCKFNAYCSEPIDSFAIALDPSESEENSNSKPEPKPVRGNA